MVTQGKKDEGFLAAGYDFSRDSGGYRMVREQIGLLGVVTGFDSPRSVRNWLISA